MKKTAIYQQKRPGSSRLYNKWIQSPAWLRSFGIAAALCLIAYAAQSVFGMSTPGGMWEIGYGIAACVMLVGILTYSLRRKFLRIPRFQRAWQYLQFHIYGGVFFLLLVFMHTGFRLPDGVITGWLWGLSVWIVSTGLLGNALQKWIPAMLNAGLTTEVHYDRIPALIDETRQRADRLIQSCEEEIQEFYRQRVAAMLRAPRPRWSYFFDPAGSIQHSTKKFEVIGKYLPETEQKALATLQQLYKTKLEMDAHYTLQRALRGWLYLHIPFAVLLVAFILVHVFTVYYY